MARLLDATDDYVVDATISLNALGMNSMAKAQFKGIVFDNYSVELDEEMLFDDDTTLETIARVIEHGPESVHTSPKAQETERVNTTPPPESTSSSLCKACGC